MGVHVTNDHISTLNHLRGRTRINADIRPLRASSELYELTPGMSNSIDFVKRVEEKATRGTEINHKPPFADNIDGHAQSAFRWFQENEQRAGRVPFTCLDRL